MLIWFRHVASLHGRKKIAEASTEGEWMGQLAEEDMGECIMTKSEVFWRTAKFRVPQTDEYDTDKYMNNVLRVSEAISYGLSTHQGNRCEW